jgi:acyl-CoA synthetase (AMP-forming)/AMP-acid ligase II
MNLLAPFLEGAEARAARTAIVGGDGAAATFGELVQRSAALAAAWRRRGLAAGDRVLLAAPLAIDLYVALIALWRLGAAVVLPEPALGLAGLRHAATVTRPKALLTAGWFRLLRYGLPELRAIPLALAPDERAAGAEPAATLAPDHPALISFTSGSTGAPKAMVRSHGMLARQNACVVEMLAPKRADEVDLVAFPVFVLANLGLGVTSVLPNWDLRRHDLADPATITRIIKERRITRALVPPSICEKLAAAEPVALGAIFTGGGPVFPDLLERLAAKLPATEIVTVYGSTEAEPIAHVRVADIGPDDWRAMRDGAGLLVGRPVDAIEMAIRDSEIVVTGEHVNKGYLDPAHDRDTKLAIGERVWHRTGDAGRLDAARRLWLLGRRDGEVAGLFPFCVETAARCWPGVVRSALVGIDGRAVLAVEGDADAIDAWKRKAAAIGDIRVVPVRAIPLDRRHRSKVDYPALRGSLTAAMA